MVKQTAGVIDFADRILSKAVLSETASEGTTTARLYAYAAERFKVSGDPKQAEFAYLKAAEISLREKDREQFRKFAVEAVALDLGLIDLIKSMIRDNADVQQKAAEVEGLRSLAVVKRDYEEKHKISMMELRVRKTLDIWSFKADRTKELLLIKGLASWEYVEDLTLGTFELVIDKAYAIREWFWETFDKFLE